MDILQQKGYILAIGDIRSSLPAFLQKNKYPTIALLADEHTKRLCVPRVLDAVGVEYPVIEIPAGEFHKNLDTCRLVWQQMQQLHLDRRSLMIHVGGGVVSDLGGFCAATWLRGIDFIHVPTSLLAQVDASLGGKLGVDFNFAKNSIGVFANPKSVFVDPTFLYTLPLSEIRSGFAEIIKHALIGNARLWRKLQTIQDLGNVNWADFILPSLNVKQRIIRKDPRETGLRKVLNFGHTIGHAMESFSLQTPYPLLHGEAVALGMMAESLLSTKLAGLPEQQFQEIVRFISRFYPMYLLDQSDYPKVIEWMKHDKKNCEGRLNFTLLKSIGKPVWDQFCNADAVVDALNFINALEPNAIHFVNF